MHRLTILLLMVIYVVGCSPKLATKVTTEDYTEDVSAFRPKFDPDVKEPVDQPSLTPEKGSYVPPTHDINREMNSIMDSIVLHNQDKLYLTYTIQVYIGKSREEANLVREKVYRVLPEEKPILNFRQPSWRVTVGKYFNREDAYKALNMLRENFPEALLDPERKHME